MNFLLLPVDPIASLKRATAAMALRYPKFVNEDNKGGDGPNDEAFARGW
ncbi:MAG TPA: hypothetical protein VEA63_16935 [Opitutus sp.]|nr:hypothetical protein [Opitutus sp.]